MTQMIGTEKLEEVLKASILSSKVGRTDVRPVCIFLIAPPERGKTSIALSIAEHALVITDISALGILDTLRLNPKATHIVLTDLMAVSGHKDNVKCLTVTMLNALAEEGSYKIALPNTGHLDMGGRKIGIIACGVPEMFNDNRMWWINSGFISRLLVLSFDHSPALVMKILNDIATHDGKTVPTKQILPLPEKPIHVEIKERESREIMALAMHLAHKNDELGYRKQKQLRSLACGHALLRKKWKKVQLLPEDTLWLSEIAPFIEGDKNGLPVKIG